MKYVPASLFDIGSCIGEGKNGKVYLLRLRDTDSEEDTENRRRPSCVLLAGKSYSFKFMNECREKLLNEIAIHQSLDHPHIVRLHACFFSFDRVFFAMDLGFSDFFHYLTQTGPLDEQRARPCLAQVLAALLYLHAQEIIFSDLKPENLIVFAGTDAGRDVLLKLSDFGSAQRVQSSTALSGTVEYQAPEQKAGLEYTEKIDMYAAGILLCEMLTLQTPHINLALNFSDSCSGLFANLTSSDPGLRLSAAAALHHPFFS